MAEVGATREIGVIVAGAGARGAYEAGLLGHLIPEIAAGTQAEGLVPRFTFLGTSAGSLNSALIASRAPAISPGDSATRVRNLWADVMEEVAEIWRGISEGRVLGLLPNGRLLGAFTRVIPGAHVPLVSLLNTDPLVELANDPAVVNWEDLHQRVADGVVSAVGAAATARDGRTVLFLDRHDASLALDRDEVRDIDYVDVPGGLLAEHVLASSAIPVAFPPQRVNQPPECAGWYYDGGVRLNTPLKPAILLGLHHLLIVGTHPDHYDRSAWPDPTKPSPEIDEAVVPVINQLLADQLVQDLQTLRSRNALPGQAVINHVFAGPPKLGTLAELARTEVTGLSLARLLRHMLAGPARWELSSYLLFDKGYLGASIDAGWQRAADPDVLPHGPTVAWRT